MVNVGVKLRISFNEPRINVLIGNGNYVLTRILTISLIMHMGI